MYKTTIRQHTEMPQTTNDERKRGMTLPLGRRLNQQFTMAHENVILIETHRTVRIKDDRVTTGRSKSLDFPALEECVRNMPVSQTHTPARRAHIPDLNVVEMCQDGQCKKGMELVVGTDGGFANADRLRACFAGTWRRGCASGGSSDVPGCECGQTYH